MDFFGLMDDNSSDSTHWPKSRIPSTSEPQDLEIKEKKEEFVTVTFPDGKTVLLPFLTGTQGPPAIDVRTLYSKANCFTFDPGFTSTCSCESTITYIDGPNGILQHRGYDINDLCGNTTFSEVIYLLLYGELPSKPELVRHDQHLKANALVHERLIKFYDGFKADAHPMAICVGVIGAMAAFFHDSLNIHDPTHRALSAYRLIAKMPTIAAMAYKTSVGEPIVYPRDDLSYAGNFLHMLFATPNKPYVVSPVMEKALDTFLILHADHEQNASTSTVRIAGSSQANPFACIASGITALWGPSHGGANEAVLDMLSKIGTVDNIPAFLAKAKDKSDPFRLMGFGHRVYKNHDPRAVYMRKVCYEVLKEMGVRKEPLLDLAIELEKKALEDEYFIKRKLFPNVDFYSGIVLKALRIPVSMFTVLFAVARTTGWVSQWKEMIENPNQRIGRPRQLFVGQLSRKVVPLEARGKSSLQRAPSLGEY